MMNLPQGFSCQDALNTDIPVIKTVIFQVMEEFGMPTGDQYLDGDLVDIEKGYQNGFFGLIKNADQQIIGTFALYKLNDASLELRKMYLLPEYRSKGIGRWMLQFAIQKAKNLGYNKLELQTASVLHAAIAMYRKSGFDEVTSSGASPTCDRAFEMYL